VNVARAALIASILAVQMQAPAFAQASASAQGATADRPAGRQPQPASRQGRLFPPTDLGLLESPDRAAWQKPDLIMDALGISENAMVADVGAGSGFFTVRLARRVRPPGCACPNGVVYAEDIQQPMLESIKRRVSREGLNNVVTRLGTSTDAKLPKGALDAVLVVDVYGELDEESSRIGLLRHLADTLKPNGRIGIVNYKPGEGGPGPDPVKRLESSVVEAEVRAAGLRVLDGATLPFQYLLVVGK
jgi:SAM-dependent methyltransferase